MDRTRGYPPGTRGLTTVSLGRWSAVGGASPQTLATSARALSCHDGFVASSMMAQVRSSADVSWPAKKNVLHSSTIVWVSYPSSPLPDDLVFFFSISASSIPRSPMPHADDGARPSSAISRLRWMDSLSNCSSSPFSRFISRLYLLGKYLIFLKKSMVRKD
jgi:hypothetical protein